MVILFCTYVNVNTMYDVLCSIICGQITALSHSCEHNRTTMATQDPNLYLAILKASYDYEPQSEDEIAVKEDQLLFLIERVDEESVVL